VIMSTPVIFDIETGPLPDEQLQEIIPAFDVRSFPKPLEFNPALVKYGNTKDEAKRAIKLAEEAAKHEKAVADYDRDLENKIADYWQEQTEKAALSALTGEVLAIGYLGAKEAIDHVGENSKGEIVTERMLLSRFWSQYRALRKDSRKMIGYSIAFFDIPFMVQRSWILGVSVPDTVFTFPSRYLEPTFIDLAQVWSASARGQFVKLDTICRAMGVPGKPAGINGGDFARLFHDPSTRQEAIDYLSGDLRMTQTVAQRVGLA
jgi:hypothetical protein